MDDSLFRQLDEVEAESFREWAREKFEPGVAPNPLWHPVVRAEWARLQAEHDHITETLHNLT